MKQSEKKKTLETVVSQRVELLKTFVTTEDEQENAI
jgi:hypothetical protein